MSITPIEIKTSQTIEIPELTQELVTKLIHARHQEDITYESYLDSRLKALMPDPFVITGMTKAVEILKSAIDSRQNIMVCSDYDADGVCSAAIMTLTLRALDAAVNSIIIPDRFKDGHGLSDTVVERIITAKPHLLVVLDVGTTATAAVRRLTDASINVIAADHHHAPEGMPTWPKNAFLLNPGIAGGVKQDIPPVITKSLGDLCAAGLTLLLCVALRRAMNRPDVDLNQQLGLSALGTVADMVPMIQLNRAIVRAGLPHMASVAGLRAIAGKSRLNIEQATAQNCGFVYGPCLNAAGRVNHAGLALDLLLATDPDSIDNLSTQLVELNNERRALQVNVVTQSLDAIHGLTADHGIIVQNDDWHAGVIGLAASRLMDLTKRPAIVIGHGGVGSGRSPSNFHIGDFIAKARASGLLLTGGGHAAAGGFKLKSLSDLASFKEVFEAETKGIIQPEPGPDIIVDARFFDKKIDFGYLITDVLQVMEPTGMHNERPTIEITNVELRPGRVFGGEQQHASMFAQIGTSSVEVSVFKFAEMDLKLEDFRRTRLASSIKGTFEPGFPNPRTCKGRITLKKMEFLS
jgi:single-stranded-DNA-specific exonuclease